ncbi:MAG: T9SS type A sorting domain-containing protein [Bacteroidetes bacterium]|nr:T9SS type A sorting domain-containing protein [Bacteroidota bacterium]
MKKALFAFYSFMLICMFANGQFQIGHTAINFVDSSRNNRVIPTEIYYPAVVAGENVPVAGSEKFPLVVFGHGYLTIFSAYQNIWEALVLQGYIVALPRTEGSLFPSHLQFGNDLAFLPKAFNELNATSTSLFFKRYSEKVCVAGHSMGAGATFLASAGNNAITALAVLAPAETNPSAVAACNGIAIPCLIFAGSNDCITPPSTTSQVMYDSLDSQCKTYLNINGASHCQFANYNFNCSFGETTCITPPTITRAVQHTTVNKYLIPYLNYFLKNNCQSWFNMQDSLSTATEVIWQQACLPQVNCTAPINRTTKNITSTSAKLQWLKPTCCHTIELRYKLSTAQAYSWTNVIGAVSSYSLTGLQPATGYTWQVRTVCDDDATVKSPWSAKRTFTTASNRIGDEGTDDVAEQSEEIVISPNPGNGKFIVSCENYTGYSIKFVVYNFAGRKMLQKTEPVLNHNFEVEMDMTMHPKGIYILQIFTPDEIVTRRLVIE